MNASIYGLTLSATLDRPVPPQDTLALGRRIAHERVLSVAVHDARFSLTVAAGGASDPGEVVATECAAFVEALADAGYGLVSWEAVELLSPAETDRRIETTGLPEMISAKEFAELCGFRSHQRIYDLDSERRRAAAEGAKHPFPTPIVPGWWIRRAAERYATTRKRTPGPAPKGRNPFREQRDYPKPIDPNA